MKIDSLSDLPSYPLPASFSVRSHVDGDETRWAEIETAAGEFPDLEAAAAHHQREFGGHDAELRDRRFYLFDPGGSAVGTATAWFHPDYLGAPSGRLHWVAIVPDWQGRHLAKPLVSVAMRKIAAHHDRAFLTTQTTSYKAIRVYLDFGFRPHIADEAQRRGWMILSEILNMPWLARWATPGRQ
jgi:ribosomal protein S18 acetylase RimI-like enzyme